MNDGLNLLIPFAAGLLLGLVFFGGLWITAGRGLASNVPAIWFFVSLLLRMSVALAGFYLVAAGELSRLIACLAGFVVFRVVMTGKMRISRQGRPSPNSDGYD